MVGGKVVVVDEEEVSGVLDDDQTCCQATYQVQEDGSLGADEGDLRVVHGYPAQRV